MKKSKILLGLTGMLCSLITLNCKAQTPQAFNYQAIIRNSSGNPMASTNVFVRSTIHNNSSSGSTEYQEIFTVTTNQFGLINLQIGTGTVVTGIFDTISWGNGTKWIQIEANFGTGYVSMGTSQLVSVPYALNALNGGIPSGIISMWSGLLANIPTGWHLCDGTNGTPDLRDRFVCGVTSSETPGILGGDSTYSFPVPMTSLISGATSSSQLGYDAGDQSFCSYQASAWWESSRGSSNSATNYYGTEPTSTTSAVILPPYYKLAFIMKL